MSGPQRSVLVTGFPTVLVATRLVRRLAEDESLRIRCLVPRPFLERAAHALRAIDAGARDRVDVVEGDVASLDFGMAGRSYIALASELSAVHHAAAVSHFGASPELAERVNVGGAREIAELAEVAPRLERIVAWSTAWVSGRRRGYVLETDLDDSAGFHGIVEETRFRAERLLRRLASRHPVIVLRPTTIVGDSVTGEIDRLTGPYLLVRLLLSGPRDLRLPLPLRAEAPLNLVPIDYVVEAGLAIAADDRAIGRTFHIVDPDPLPARRVFELLARATGRPLPRGWLPTGLAAALLRVPGLERLAADPRAFLEQLSTEVVHDDRGARELLAGRGIRCPRFETYVDRLVEHVRRTVSAPTATPDPDAAQPDPLDQDVPH
ncbi:MAG: SDR family oxidoreductase [Myxococcota bacterium]|nr:SDR family oxidoreductase [Myxococcota bacterium]MDW8362432.1 SDR family oxidoreductase [Myxococcales bacterium]